MPKNQPTKKTKGKLEPLLIDEIDEVDATEAFIDLIPKQQEAWECIFVDELITELGYGGAAGGGKTRLGWYVSVFGYCEKYPGCRFAVGRKELKTLRITTLAELFIIFAEIGYVKDIDYVFNAQDSIMRFPNGSEILLLDTAYSPQDPEYTRFGSLNLTGAWIEESNETPEKAKTILKTRVGRHNKFFIDGKETIVKALWLETFNPNKGHVHRDYHKPAKEGTMPEYRAFIRALPGDNPHLPKAYIEGLQRSDKTTKERLLYGNFDYDADPNRLMEYDSILDLRTNTLPGPGTTTTGEPIRPEKYLINDIARQGGDKIVLAEFEDMTLTGLEVYTYQDTDQTTTQISDRMKESRIPASHTLSDEDGVGGGVVDNLKGTKGFMGGSRPLSIYDSFTAKEVSENFINLRSQCYFKLAEAVNAREMAVRLRYFKTNIEGYTQEKAIADLEEELDAIKKADDSGQRTKLAVIPKSEIKEALGRSPDFADVMMMRMLFELKEAPVRKARERREMAKPRPTWMKKEKVINKAL